MNILATTIKEKRKASNLSQDRLAKLVGSNQFMISHIETGKTQPSPELLNKLQSILGFVFDGKTNKILIKKTMLNPFTKEELINLRQTHNITQSDLANGIGVHCTTIYKIEKGLRNAGKENQKAIIQFFTSLSSGTKVNEPVKEVKPKEIKTVKEVKEEVKTPTERKFKYTPSFDRNRLKELRSAQGLSLSELGEKVGVSAASIGFWENGQTKPNSVNLAKLEEVLGSFQLDKQKVGEDFHKKVEGMELRYDGKDLALLRNPYGVMGDNLPPYLFNISDPLEEAYKRTAPDFVTVKDGKVEEHYIDSTSKPISVGELYQTAQLEKERELLKEDRQALQKIKDEYEAKLAELNLSKATKTTDESLSAQSKVSFKLVVADTNVPTVKLSEVGSKFYGILNKFNVKGYMVEKIKGGSLIIIGLEVEDCNCSNKKELVKDLFNKGYRVYEFENLVELTKWFSE